MPQLKQSATLSLQQSVFKSFFTAPMPFVKTAPAPPPQTKVVMCVPPPQTKCVTRAPSVVRKRKRKVMKPKKRTKKTPTPPSSEEACEIATARVLPVVAAPECPEPVAPSAVVKEKKKTATTRLQVPAPRLPHNHKKRKHERPLDFVQGEMQRVTEQLAEGGIARRKRIRLMHTRECLENELELHSGVEAAPPKSNVSCNDGGAEEEEEKDETAIEEEEYMCWLARAAMLEHVARRQKHLQVHANVTQAVAQETGAQSLSPAMVVPKQAQFAKSVIGVQDVVEEFHRHNGEQVPSIVHVDNPDICSHCSEPLVMCPKEARMVCPQTGHTENYLDATATAQAYGEKMDCNTSPYETINHLNETLIHKQAKESTPFPIDIKHKIMEELFRRGFRSTDDIAMQDTLIAMRELGYRRYYKRNTQLWCDITGNSPPRFSPLLEEQLRLMFRAVYALWPKYKPKKRTNFLGYSFNTVRFLVLLGYEELVPLFNVMKGRDKILMHNNVFTNFCRELDWQDVPLHHQALTQYCKKSKWVASTDEDVSKLDRAVKSLQKTNIKKNSVREEKESTSPKKDMPFPKPPPSCVPVAAVTEQVQNETQKLLDDTRAVLAANMCCSGTQAGSPQLSPRGRTINSALSSPKQMEIDEVPRSFYGSPKRSVIRMEMEEPEPKAEPEAEPEAEAEPELEAELEPEPEAEPELEPEAAEEGEDCDTKYVDLGEAKQSPVCDSTSAEVTEESVFESSDDITSVDQITDAKQISSLKMDQIRKICRKFGLKTRGKKAILISALVDTAASDLD